MSPDYDRNGLIDLIKSEFKLDWHGIHGVSHWARVRANGLRLAEMTGANPHVVELFAFLHDSKRLDDGYDPMHGSRAAEFAKQLADVSVIQVTDTELDLLMTACEGHSNGLTTGDITVLTCWDADRLDLGRVYIKPEPRFLCTTAAVDILEWAYQRSQFGL